MIPSIMLTKPLTNWDRYILRLAEAIENGISMPVDATTIDRLEAQRILAKVDRNHRRAGAAN